MPRRARIDFKGALHHVIIRGINRAPVFYEDGDRRNFLRRLARGLDKTGLLCYAWALIPNHIHLLLKTVITPLEKLMRTVLTGYAISFNLRHKRVGYLFQGRFKSILCEEEEYLLQLVRYIHLNPIRAKLVSSIEELDVYPWCGHSVLMDNRNAEWQETDEILALFGSTMREAQINYHTFILEGISEERQPDLTGGGLIRSAGGWGNVKRLRKGGEHWRGDERILGSKKFTQDVLSRIGEDVTQREKRESEGMTMHALFKSVLQLCNADSDSVLKGRRDSVASKVRALFSLWATDELGASPTEIARFLGISRSAFYKAAKRGMVITREEKLRFPLKEVTE